MKRNLIFFSILSLSGSICLAQSAISGYNLAQPDLKGTARYMGMAGAFGALGGDLSAISLNPGGIGVYRSSDVGFTVDLDLQSSAPSGQSSMRQTKFLLNNIGGVFTLKLNNNIVPNFNFGFTYNKCASFNRVYGGNFAHLNTSMSNYIAGIANDPVLDGVPLSMNEISWGPNYSYNPYDNYDVPWIAALGYESFLINPQIDPNDPTGNRVLRWDGLWQNSMNSEYDTSGSGRFLMQEQGGTNEFNIVLGGNIANMLYWGMNFNIVNVNYKLYTTWAESLINAYGLSGDDKPVPVRENVDWNLNSLYSLSGNGFQYQFGLIFKPVQQFRIGFAFHTPTWYNLNEQYMGSVDFKGDGRYYYTPADDGVPGATGYNFRTPWKIIASAAGVIGNNFILSFDYEWANYGKMKFYEQQYYDGGYNDWYDPWYPYSLAVAPSTRSDYWYSDDPYAYENMDISTYYKSTNTFRVGAEFKPVSSLSIRAGYSYVSSPVKKEAKDNRAEIFTSSLSPSYRFDNETNYITCGLGYRYSRFYIDLAYVYKVMTSEYHAYAPDTSTSQIVSPQTKITFKNNQLVLTAGFRF